MKEVIFDHSPQLDPKQQRVADMHSVLNVLNVLLGELQLIELLLDGERAARFATLRDQVEGISKEICESGEAASILGKVRASENTLVSAVRDLLDELEDEATLSEVRDSLSNMESVYSVVHKRLDELEERSKDPDIWIVIQTKEFEQRFREVFYAIEKNARGRYRIYFNLARKTEDDYYIDLKVESALDGETLWIPLRLMDVIRDLTANARKYTPPGGQVALAIYQSKDDIQVLVEDSGYGIPEYEIERVVEFGYRASNVRQRPTMGGGFGLTKAVWLISRWGGQLSITSGEGEGTSVRFSIPNKVRAETGELPHSFVI